MNPRSPFHPPTLALFEKRIEGDDCLMELARLRFQQAGMGTEIYAATPELLAWALRFRPEGNYPVVAHLSRGLQLTDRDGQQQIENFARRFAGQLLGLVIHDQPMLASNPRLYARAAGELNSRLQQITNSPWLFIEYAAGVELESFVNFFEAIRELSRISVCVDIGHVGIQQVRKAYSANHSGQDVCALKTNPELIRQAMPDVEKAVASALPVVLDLVEQLGTCGKPAHCHLHDGHPLSTFSPFGVADHLSFLAEIPLSFEYLGQRQTGLMFGPDGLYQFVAKSLQAFDSQGVSFTLEIHPTADRLPLGDATELFNNWRDLTNAERMHHWLSVLAQNHHLLCDAIQTALNVPPPVLQSWPILGGREF